MATSSTPGSGTNIPPTHRFDAVATVTDAESADIDSWVTILAQDANGEDTYDNEKAMIGHLEAKYHLVIDKKTESAFSAQNAIKVSLKTLGKKNGIANFLGKTKIAADHRASYPYHSIHEKDENERKLCLIRLTALNFASLREAGLKKESAFVCAALRARWILTGAYSVSKYDSNAAYEEVLKVDRNHSDYGRIVAAKTSQDIVANLGKYAAEFKTEYSHEKHGMRFITLHAENLWAAVEHCFRVRNHHFKNQKEFYEGYADLYTRFMTAAYEGTFEWPAGVEMYDVFRIAIHPFKLKALPVMTAHFVVHGKVANAAITRTSGSPCGNAAITTAVAALDTMEAEVWWPAFKRAYSEAIEAVTGFASQINDDKYSFHISAGLYGMTRKNTVEFNGSEISVEEAKSKVSLVASACQGMISALESAKAERLITRFALQNAKALEKPAAASPLLALRITQLVTASLNSIGASDDIASAIAGALPTLDKLQEEKVRELN